MRKPTTRSSVSTVAPSLFRFGVPLLRGRHAAFFWSVIMKNDSSKQLSINGLSCWVNTPPAPSGEGQIHGLPPYCERTVHCVDEYPACPKNWMNGSGVASSYFLSVDPGQHLWLDFNGLWQHQHDVAIVLSVQGINPITGQKTNALRLEQYREKCPQHDCAFGGDRYCEKCKTKLPAQNYMATASTPHGLLWIDGWRADGGRIRGFLITKETMRGVAAQLIGDERVFAIGIAFFLSKTPKPKTHHAINTVGLASVSLNDGGALYGSSIPVKSSDLDYGGYEFSYKAADTNPVYKSASPKHSLKASHSASSSTKRLLRSRGVGGQSAGPSHEFETPTLGFSGVEREVEPTTLEIGAGARISQELAYFDNNQLDYYQDVPAGCIYINYADKATCDSIIAAGKVARPSEGFLGGLRVGN